MEEGEEDREFHPLLSSSRRRGARSGPQDPGSSSYRSFDNVGFSSYSGETHLCQDSADDRLQNGAKPTVTIHTAPDHRRPEAICRAEGDGDTASVLTIEEGENDFLSGEEILFRLRLAHIHGNLNWVKHLRQLPKRSSEGVHMELLDHLRELPIDIHQKKKLSRYLRDRLDATSVHSLTNKDTRKRQESHRHKFRVDVGIWNDNIGKISAYFGSHVASYFVFLRFLVYLDVLTALLLFGLLTLPQILSNENAAPEGLSGDFGVLSRSVMFFGAYSDTKWGLYDRPLAFLLTWASVNVLSFIIIVASMYVKYNASKRSDTNEDEFPFSMRVFSSWDHTLSRSEGAALRAKAIVTHTKEMVREERSTEHKDCFQRFLRLSVRVVVNVVVVGVLGGSGYLIFLVADNRNTPLSIPSWLDDFLRPYKLPLVVAGLKMLVPPLLELVIGLEGWAPRTELKITIFRTWLFYVASLVVLLLSMYDVSSQCVRDANSTLPLPLQNLSGVSVCCWENEVGEEVLKVILIDLGQILLTTLLLDYLRAALIKSGNCTKLGYREFTVASEVLDLIYGQSLVWLGLFFSPLLAAVGCVKLVVLFYFSYVTARLCKVPPRRVFRASRSGNFFLFVLLLNFFACLFTMTYAVIELEPSYHCGPFKTQDHVYAILTSRVGDLPSWLRDVIVYVSTPAIVVPFILFLLLCVLYFKAKSASYVKVISKLREQLRFERRVQKREVFARARFVQGPQMSHTPSFPSLGP
ncbi:transmembrane channel-like protein 3 [Babylonia areolata]|uniref:transmembrane channel-like protein 3 n=1 Tax=Babylonia areolata TaxID=304850 RepID=UPI003FD2F2B7